MYRASGCAAYDRIDEPSETPWDIPAKSNRFQLYVHSAVPLFKPGDAEQSPN
jgi:hypothetical protein